MAIGELDNLAAFFCLDFLTLPKDRLFKTFKLGIVGRYYVTEVDKFWADRLIATAHIEDHCDFMRRNFLGILGSLDIDCFRNLALEQQNIAVTYNSLPGLIQASSLIVGHVCSSVDDDRVFTGVVYHDERLACELVLKTANTLRVDEFLLTQVLKKVTALGV